MQIIIFIYFFLRSYEKFRVGEGESVSAYDEIVALHYQVKIKERKRKIYKRERIKLTYSPRSKQVFSKKNPPKLSIIITSKRP